MTGEQESGADDSPDAGSDGFVADGGESANDATGDDGSVVRRDRFSGGPARDFLSSMDADERIFAADLAVDRAHVIMLAEQDVVDDATAGEILAALDDVEQAGYETLPGGEDVHEAIESAVIERIGPDGGRMHTARSRNDEVATCIRYRLREDVLDAVETVLGLREVLVNVGDAERETLMPGYTHLQPAQPITVAHWAGSYESTLQRDAARLLDAYGRLNESPLGAAAFAGTPFDIDRERTADLLGFDAVVENAMDASASRDVLLETTAALSTLATTLSGLAEDVIVFANRGFLELSDDYSSTSSIMPQKKNPDTLELVRAVAGDAAGAHQGLTTTLKGLPRAYNRDLQRATPHVWGAVDDVIEATEVAAGAVATADWNDDVLADAAGEGFSTATGVADLLASNGVPFRTAHEVVASAAQRAAERASGETASSAAQQGSDLDAVEAAAAEHLDGSLSAYVDREAVEAVLEPAESVASRDSLGGPAPEAAADALERAREALDADADALDARRAALADAAETLRAEVDEYA